MDETDGFRGLRLHNTLSRRKEDFLPLDPRNVRLYVCGPTVYDFAHIGNARPVVVFDVLYRLLRHLYGAEHVTYVRNVTDVDDKINQRAAERGVSIRDLTEDTLRQFHVDVRALGALDPTHEPRATEHIEEMKAMIEALVAAGVTYVAEGHVLFAVAARPDYGRLSGRSPDEMLAGARVEVAPYKRDAMDFVLWKPSKPGEPAWPSPCGIAAPGRPGWHIECSAMADKWLWQAARHRLGPQGLAHPHQFDIHGGGIDLVFPHHENELAQSCAAHGTPGMARYWLHNGFLQVEGEKMSKSLGNFVTVRELLHDWPGEAIRLALLMTHYRQPLDFTEERLRLAKMTLDHWYRLIAESDPDQAADPEPDFLNALKDDLNTPGAIARLHSLFSSDRAGAAAAIASARLLGLLHQDSEAWHAWRPADFSVDEDAVAARIADRAAARKARDWAAADRIRAELEAMGIALKDSRDPQTGELVTDWEVQR